MAAIAVFDDSHRLAADSTKPEYGEVHSKAVGQIRDGRLITVVYTDRGRVRRIISEGEMKDERMSRVRVKQLADGTAVQVRPDGSVRPLEDQSDWTRFDALTEAEVAAAALADPDDPPMTNSEVARLRRVPNPREIRKQLRMTQVQFARRFHLPLETLRDWAQGVRMPDSAARSYLRVIAKNPQAVLDALEN